MLIALLDGPFSGVFTTLMQLVLDMMSVAQKAMGVVTRPLAFVQLAFFVGGIALILWHVFVQNDGDNMASMVKNFVKTKAKILMVGILVANGGFLTDALASVARSQATSGLRIFGSLFTIVSSVDVQFEATMANMSDYPLMAASAMKIESDYWITQDSMLRLATEDSGSPGFQGNTRLTKGLDGLKKRAAEAVDKQKSNLAKAAATKNPQMRSVYTKLAENAGKDAENYRTTGAEAENVKQRFIKKKQALDEDHAANGLKPDEIPVYGAVDHIVQKEAEANSDVEWGPPGLFKKVDRFFDWFYSAPAFLVGYGAGLIMLLGVVILGVTVIKEAFAVATYLAGFLITLNLAAAIAAPLAPVFFCMFLWDKTESYARTYIGFWFSAIFASAGLAAMSTVVVAMLGSLNGALGSEVAVNYATLFQAKTAGEILGAAIGSAAALVCLGMCMSFALDLVKRGAAVGAGIWSGSFPT